MVRRRRLIAATAGPFYLADNTELVEVRSGYCKSHRKRENIEEAGVLMPGPRGVLA